MVANWFPVDIHAEVFNGGDFRAASLAAAAVDAVPTDGGWIINGTAPYCSGIPYSTYFLGQARLPGTKPDGSPRLGVYLAPQDSYVRLDDWGHMHGLNGSGSHSIRFTDAFLPERFMLADMDLRTVGVEGPSAGSAAYGNAMYSSRHGSTFAMLLAALVLGGGYNALDAFEEQMRKRTTTVPPFIPRTEDGDFLRYYGQTRVKLAIAEGALFHAVHDWTRFAESNASGGAPFTLEQDDLLAAIGRELMIDVWRIVTQNLWEFIGAAASVQGQRFERIYRDIAQAAAHRNPQLRDIQYKVIAQAELGLERTAASNVGAVGPTLRGTS
jgi:3-hydroxy-9,10-secoandrosta-1,3,5(10)-triene-9,17-dione monooxygenase